MGYKCLGCKKNGGKCAILDAFDWDPVVRDTMVMSLRLVVPVLFFPTAWNSGPTVLQAIAGLGKATAATVLGPTECAEVLATFPGSPECPQIHRVFNRVKLVICQWERWSILAVEGCSDRIMLHEPANTASWPCCHAAYNKPWLELCGSSSLPHFPLSAQS